MTNALAATEQTTFCQANILNALAAQTEIHFHVPADLTFRPGILQMLEADTQIQFQLHSDSKTPAVSIIDSISELTLLPNRQFALC